MGALATWQLNQLVAGSTLDVTKVACARQPGTEGRSHCNFGRSCGTLRANGRDVGEIPIEEGLAVDSFAARPVGRETRVRGATDDAEAADDR